MLDIQSYLGSPKILVEAVDEVTTKFVIQYLPRWFWHTLWNALRRAVLWYSAWGSITGLKIKWVMHEYHVVDGVKQSMFEIMSNFKKLRFKTQEATERLQRLTMRSSGVGVMKANDLKLPAWITLLTPEVELFEISEPGVELIIEYRLEKWFGYYSLEYLRSRDEKEEATDVNLLLIDNDFKAVRYVTYEVEEVIDDFIGWSKDKLTIDIQSVSPLLTGQEILSFAGEVVSSYAKLFIFEDAYIDSSLMVDYYDIVDAPETSWEKVHVKTIPIDALPLSERTRNALIKNDILYVEDLEKKRKSELLTMKGIGKKAVDEIEASLQNMNKKLSG
jgi:DNA-directed RNA polymerase subunit alpha